MKKNIKIILLLSLLFLIPKNTKALEENEYYLFKEFKYNDITIPEFIVDTNLCYLKTYYTKYTDNYYYNWKPQKENKEETYIIVYNKILNQYELHIQMRNYEYYDYGYSTNNYKNDFEIVYNETTNKTIYRTTDTKTEINISGGSRLTVQFILINGEWIQNTNIYTTTTIDNTTYSQLHHYIQSKTNFRQLLLNQLEFMTNRFEVIKSTYKIYDQNNNIIEYTNYKNKEEDKDYQIEDSTEEKETINENEIKLNEDITKLIKTNLIQVSKNDSLYKLILITFITSLIIIIKRKI